MVENGYDTSPDQTLRRLRLDYGSRRVDRGEPRAASAPWARYEETHTTRMVPKRVDELLDGGSLFWVIKGQVAARQMLLAVRPFTDADGIGRCHLVLEPKVVAIEPRPYRPFQGWR